MQESTFSLSELNLTALCWGDPSKPMLLALHGWLDNAATFSRLAPLLTDYYVVAMDMAGHGHADHRSADAHYHLTDFVQDLHELICRQGWQELTLIGHSLGGIIASLYAGTFPEKVASLVSIESFGPLVMEPSTSTEQLRKSIESRLAIRTSAQRHPQSLEQAVRARLVAGHMQAESARMLVERNLYLDGEVRWRTDRRLRTISSLRLTEEQAGHFLSAIKCPMLVIAGHSGFDKVKANITRRKDLVANLKVAFCPGGHHLHLDEPEAIAQTIAAFLGQSTP